jgi:phage host-nuclease inhibitor protein Gam
MARSARRKTQAADFPVPQTRESAAVAIARIGSLRRRIAAQVAATDEQIATIASAIEGALKPVRDELEGLEKGVQVYAEANRLTLTGGGRVQHHDFATGKVLWRKRPAKVTLRSVVAVIERLKAMELDRFLRTRVEVDKEAMLKEPDVAGGIAGVTIASDGEDFAIEPAAIETDGSGG